MRLSEGTQLGVYRVLSLLGEGGMGEVYRALDTSLDREVAIKLLATRFAADAAMSARFEQEARVLASLRHPGIAAIHGIGTDAERRYLVLELVEGETLAERIDRGDLDLPEILEIGRQLAEALDAAHRQGVVHRDLKPLNIKIRSDGTISILDFGLAKALGGDPGGSAAETLAVTQPGARLGTPAYMSPEQCRGEGIDPRADLWALGCVLFEMVARCTPFTGTSSADLMVAVLEREPAWERLPRDLPVQLRDLLGDCLQKSRSARVASAREIEARLRIVAREPGAPLESLPARDGWLRRVTTLFGRRRGSGPGTATPTPATSHLSQVTFGEVVESFPFWFPSGREFLFCGELGPVRHVFRKQIGPDAPVPVTRGQYDSIQPAIAPDARVLLYVRSPVPGQVLEPGDVFGSYHRGDVWRRDLETGAEQMLLENAFNPVFSPDGEQIAFDASWAGPRRIWVADRNGRNPRQVTSDRSEAVEHFRPRWSPDGRCLVFQHLDRTQFNVRIVRLADQLLEWLTRDLSQNLTPTWSPSGRFIYFSSYRGGGINIWRQPVTSEGEPNGGLQQVTTGAGQDLEPALSPDGRRLVFAILRQNADIWRLPVDPASGIPAGEPQRLVTTSREDSRGAWSPEGDRIVFNSDRTGDMNLWIQTIDTGALRQVTRGSGGDYQGQWSPDGRHLVFFSSRNGSPGIWVVEAETGRVESLSPRDRTEVNPFFSPDGTRIAYQSDRDGRLEVWVMSRDGSGPRQLTSQGAGGHFLRWSRDGRKILYKVSGAGVFQIDAQGGEPESLPVAGGAHISLSPDASMVLDVLAHKELWVSPLRGGEPAKVFEFSDPDVRIDYPVWSPDGHWVLFDRFRPQGGDIWVLEPVE